MWAAGRGNWPCFACHTSHSGKSCLSKATLASLALTNGACQKTHTNRSQLSPVSTCLSLGQEDLTKVVLEAFCRFGRGKRGWFLPQRGCYCHPVGNSLGLLTYTQLAGIQLSPVQRSALPWDIVQNLSASWKVMAQTEPNSWYFVPPNSHTRVVHFHLSRPQT